MTADQIRTLIAALQEMLGEAPPKPIGADEIYLPITGHVFPRPRPDLGENIVGYIQRVGAATGRSTSTTGALFLGTAQLFPHDNGIAAADGSNWAEAADRWYSARAYLTPEQRAADDAARAQWTGWSTTMQGR